MSAEIGEADLPDAPHRQAGREGVPEQALRAFPLAPPPEHDDAHAAREHEQQRVRHHGAGERVPTQERAGAQVHDDVQDPEDQVSQKGPKVWERSTLA